MTFFFRFLFVLSAALLIAGCGGDNDHDDDHDDDGTHMHADGTVHRDGDHDDDNDDHDLKSLPDAVIGDLKVELQQGHGAIKAGKESHLAVKLPYSDKGSTVVRAWIGTEDRTLSNPQKGTYTGSTNVYEIHTVAPDPLPADAMWWVEVEKPDGSKAVGSAKPITE